MTETAKERIYREALEILRGMGINSKNRVMMPYGVAVTAQELIEEKLEDAENLPDDTDKLSVEKLQEIRVEELKDFNSKILQAELKNQKLQEQLNTAKKALREISEVRYLIPFKKEFETSKALVKARGMRNTAKKALAAIGGEND